jgi:hypothetical protein
MTLEMPVCQIPWTINPFLQPPLLPAAFELDGRHQQLRGRSEKKFLELPLALLGQHY